MKSIKKFGSLIIGAIFLYDFVLTFLSNNAEQYDVIGLEVSKLTYLAYLMAIAVSFLTYGYMINIENKDPENQTVSNND